MAHHHSPSFYWPKPSADLPSHIAEAQVHRQFMSALNWGSFLPNHIMPLVILLNFQFSPPLDSFPTVLTHYHKLGYLKQPKCIILKFWRPEVQISLQDCDSSGGSRGEFILLLFQFLETPRSLVCGPSIHLRSQPCSTSPLCLPASLLSEHLGLH